MKKTHYLLLAMCLALTAPLTSARADDSGHAEYRGKLRVENPWSRPTPPGTPVGVGYMTLHNAGDSPVTLLGAESPRAGHVSIHRTTMQDGVMRMLPLERGLEIGPGQTVVFEPHGYHLMLEELSKPLAEGERIAVTLELSGSGEQSIELVVKSLDGKEKMDHSSMRH